MRVQIPPGLRKSGMPELGADAGSGKDDSAARPHDRSGEVGNFLIDCHAASLANLAATRQAPPPSVWLARDLSGFCSA